MQQAFPEVSVAFYQNTHLHIQKYVNLGSQLREHFMLSPMHSNWSEISRVESNLAQ